jgi:hypothetical protein
MGESYDDIHVLADLFMTLQNNNNEAKGMACTPCCDGLSDMILICV